jgi:hypothetical protein
MGQGFTGNGETVCLMQHLDMVHSMEHMGQTHLMEHLGNLIGRLSGTTDSMGLLGGNSMVHTTDHKISLTEHIVTARGVGSILLGLVLSMTPSVNSMDHLVDHIQ